MHRIIYLIFISILSISCNSTKPLSDLEKIRLEQSKFSFLSSCLSIGYSHEQKLSELFMNDGSFKSDYPLYPKAYNAIDSLSQIVIQRANQQNLEWIRELCDPCSEDELSLMKSEGIIGNPAILQYRLNELENPIFIEIAKLEL